MSARERVYAVTENSPLPWEDGHPLRSVPLEPGFMWQHAVYGGAYALQAVRDALLEVFGETEEDHDGRMDGESALFALTVNHEGRLLVDSPVLSTCAWATGRALCPGPARKGWLDGFDEEEAVWLARAADMGEEPFEELPDVSDPGEAGEDGENAEDKLGSRRLPAKHLLNFVHDLSQCWGVVDTLRPGEIRVRSVAVRQKQADDADQQDFLNSFFVTDLDLVTRALQTREPGQGLASYLTPEAQVNTAWRVDLRQKPRATLNAVAPERTPVGRWPANPSHPLALSQQFAVNTIWAELADSSGLFAVNGPPGTGKTTMLRDCFAAVIVERARRLAGLRMPSMAFADGEPYRWQSGDYTRTVTALKPEFTGFEMVVASANNGAVENISTEIPARTALGDRWRDDADYFAEQATRLLKGAPAWGAVAARLGNKKNRMEFINRFWHGKYKITDAGAPPPPNGRPPRSRDAWVDSEQGIAHLLREWTRQPHSGIWREAKERFSQALARVERLQTERAAAAAALERLSAAGADVQAAKQAITDGEIHVQHAQGQAMGAAAALQSAEAELQRAQQALDAHARRRPGFVVSLSTLGRAGRDWHRRDQDLAGHADTTQGVRDAAATALFSAEQAVAQAEHDLASCRHRHAAAQAHLEEMEQTVEQAHEDWGDHVPQEAWIHDDTARELAAPWGDEEISAARAELLLAAMELHKAFLRCTARTMYANLMAAMDAVAGAIPKTVSGEHVKAAWQSLFLLVPVVSTTFASLDRVFGRLGSEALGWLFIDEAGQATGQMAVGGLWRAARTIVVGDPLQLEPVVVLPWTAQRALGDELGVNEEWAPSRTSVQQLADRTNRYGTLLPAELPDGSQEVWVGSPLRVHRRCDNPMFAISNAIAYDNLMVYGTPDRGDYRYRPRSCWVNVEATEADGHWMPEEGRALRRVLEKLRDDGGVDLARDVYVISPFRAVVRGAQRTCRDLLPDSRVGTIHTTQGKEADVVVLVLGSDPRRPGARSWAASRPNLLNVAVSRAKRRLFVIGNLGAWRDQRFFSTLADELPAHTWQS
ncbi:DEAD/DEAH box helicase [Streptomyces alanosinicus]|uniref:DNA helicase n=1 Tax=Streptomyces alanosinicus TaxID=68171 RepID=A0A918YQ27_9ACTN|nr:ATP-binding protein [Streptomyces alanosinicus]GHE11433.1 DNA helicase [Streptomyces alanosinicus]